MSNPVWTWFKNRFSHSVDLASATPCYWQTDVHSHLLPGLDDGVKTLEESLTCLRQLASWGIRKVITTPHINQRYPDIDSVLILSSRNALQQQLDEQQLSISLEVAAEYMLDEFFLDRLDADPLLSFGAERYLLIETSALARPLILDQMLFRIQTQGYTPVLAHPERYPYFHSDIDELARLRDQGCLLQLNWMSLTGRYGSPARVQAKELLKRNWVDLIGSDLHRPDDLPKLRALFTDSSFDLLSQQPLRNSTL